MHALRSNPRLVRTRREPAVCARRIHAVRGLNAACVARAQPQPQHMCTAVPLLLPPARQAGRQAAAGARSMHRARAPAAGTRMPMPCGVRFHGPAKRAGRPGMHAAPCREAAGTAGPAPGGEACSKRACRRCPHALRSSAWLSSVRECWQGGHMCVQQLPPPLYTAESRQRSRPAFTASSCHPALRYSGVPCQLTPALLQAGRLAGHGGAAAAGGSKAARPSLVKRAAALRLCVVLRWLLQRQCWHAGTRMALWSGVPMHACVSLQSAVHSAR